MTHHHHIESSRNAATLTPYLLFLMRGREADARRAQIAGVLSGVAVVVAAIVIAAVTVLA